MTVAGLVIAVGRFMDDRALESVMLRLLDQTAGSVPFQVLAVLTAAGVGALHALAPGHGKALIGAYLASSRGQARDAAALGGLVATMHTGSVLVLGIAFASLQRVPGGERLDAGLRLLSGLAVTAVGVALLIRHVRAAGHHHDPGHHHLPDGIAPLTRSGVLALATSGGLLPSPAAFVMLATAIAIGRSGAGLVLVLAFSLGLAGTLTAIGLSIVWGRASLERLDTTAPAVFRAVRLLPMAASALIVVGGIVLTVTAAMRL